MLCLAVKPEVILLDEPMVGLDPAAIKMLKDVVLKLRDNGATVLISTHMLEMVENLWDVMIVMEQGILPVLTQKQTRREKSWMNCSLR